MKNPDDQTLMSYVDGELDDSSVREVEQRVSRDASLRIRLRQLQELDSMIRVAFNEALRHRGEGNEVEIPKPGPSRRWSMFVTGVAASVATLLLAGGIGLHWIEFAVERELAQLEGERASYFELRAQTLNQALEEEMSGSEVSWQMSEAGHAGLAKPTKTWRTKSGTFCREFEEIVVSGDSESVESGVACRQSDGQWKVRLRYYF